MFQTEPILYLQAHASAAFHYAMLFFSRIGATEAGLLIAVFYMGANPRKGFILLQIVIVAAIGAELLKDWFALPRPLYVDNHIQILDRPRPNHAPFESMGATSFWGLLPQSVVDYYRAEGTEHWGIPSGHVSATVAAWAGLAMLLRSTGVAGAAAFVALGVAVSRMYLGKHFLADVLAGAALGIIVLLIAWLVVLRAGRIAPFMPSKKRQTTIFRNPLFYSGYFVALPIAGMILFGDQRLAFASLLGLNIGYEICRVIGPERFPGPNLPWILRGAMAVAALLVILALTQLLRSSLSPVPLVLDLFLTTIALLVFTFVVAALNRDSKAFAPVTG